MKTLRYLVAHRPHSLEDCLDLARQTPPLSVELHLGTEQLVVGMYYRAEFVAAMFWRFAAACVKVRRVCGAVSLSDTGERQRAALRRANTALGGMLRRLASAGIAVSGADRSFTPAALGDLYRSGANESARSAQTAG